MKQNNELLPLSQQVYNLLIKNNIERTQILTVLGNIYREIKNTLQVNVTINDSTLNSLRDIVWYNLEKRPQNNTLSDYGSQFPVFMNLFDSDTTIQPQQFDKLIKELSIIKRSINDTKTKMVTLNGAEKIFTPEATVHCFGKNICTSPKPIKYDEIACQVQEPVTAYKLELIKLNALIDSLTEAVTLAKKHKAYIEVDFV